jgi:predicted N-acetyltransferase YhbS
MQTQKKGGFDMALSLRRGNAADAAPIGEICYQAFKTLAERHNFVPDLPSADIAAGMLGELLAHPGFFDLVAEADGKVVGSNFLDERNPIAGLGPITVDPGVQNSGVGSALMQAALKRATERRFAGVRLVQAAYHSRSLALYLGLGFEARELLACLQGKPIGKQIAGFLVRPATADDLAGCNRLCFQVHGHERGGELADAISQGAARVVERSGRITGYATPIAFFGHAVGECDDDLKALIGAADLFPGPGFLVPARNGVLMRWCLGEGLRITQTMTLMSQGLYSEPRGAWLPSVLC